MVTGYPALPQTSAAVNIQIVEPKNFAGGATAGSMGGPGVSHGQSPYGQPGQGGQPNGYAPYGTNPFGQQQPGQYPAFTPQQQLYNSYLDALNSRNAAEQARNAYMNLSNQLNNQAYMQQQPQQFGYGQQPYNQSINAPYSPYGQFAQQYPYPQPQWPPQQWPQQFDPNSVPQPQPQPPVQQAPPAEEPPKPPKVQEPPKPQPPQEPVNPMKTASVDDLNALIANPNTLQEKVNAMEEIGVRGQGNPQTFELLKREALSDTSQLSGQALDDANYVRQASLWTMGMLNKAQNASVPTDKLPGLNVIEKILSNRKENPDVQAAAVQALQVIDRPTEKRVQKILKAAAKSKNPDVKRLANDAMSGKTIPLPTQQQNMMMFA